jgi:hypothetical protein
LAVASGRNLLIHCCPCQRELRSWTLLCLCSNIFLDRQQLLRAENWTLVRCEPSVKSLVSGVVADGHDLLDDRAAQRRQQPLQNPSPIPIRAPEKGLLSLAMFLVTRALLLRQVPTDMLWVQDNAPKSEADRMANSSTHFYWD